MSKLAAGNSDNADPIRDYLLTLAVIHGLVTVSTRSSTEQLQYGSVTSARLLGQNYRNRNHNKIRDYAIVGLEEECI